MEEHPRGEPAGEPRGRVDAVSVLYVVGGIPALVGFLVLVFWGARACDIPA
jgi:hypothetical protein